MTSGIALFFLVVVLLPLVPAYLLYRLLPGETNVEGPWHGLKIKLTGAFGGYFLLVVTLLFTSATLPTYDVWTVHGRLHLADQPVGIVDDGMVRFTVKPPGLNVQPDGRFRLTLVRVPDPSGQPELPMVIVEIPGYLPVGLDLDRQGSKSQRRRQIVIDDSIVLSPRPVVDPGGP
jgi:hypothetical protein